MPFRRAHLAQEAPSVRIGFFGVRNIEGIGKLFFVRPEKYEDPSRVQPPENIGKTYPRQDVSFDYKLKRLLVPSPLEI